MAGIGLFEKVRSEERPEDGLEASHVYFQMMISDRRKSQCNGPETNAARKLEWMMRGRQEEDRERKLVCVCVGGMGIGVQIGLHRLLERLYWYLGSSGRSGTFEPL